jgi:hypothetical protein
VTDFTAVLSLGADTTGLLKGKAALENIVGAGRKAEAAADGVTRATARLSDTASRSAGSVQRQATAVEGLARANDNARTATQEYTARLSAQARAFDDLRASIDPVFAASKRYEAAVEQTNAALRAGIISQTEANRVMDLARQKYLAVGDAADAAAMAQSRASGATGRLTSAVANASFQVQDFAVQIAAGTAVTTALAQQLPQLLGAFGLVGRVALVGSLVGTAVAVIAAVIPMLRGTADEARSAENAVDELSETMSAYAEAAQIANATTEELTQRYGRFGEQLRELSRFQRELALQQTRDMLSQIQATQELSDALSTIISLEEQRQQLESGQSSDPYQQLLMGALEPKELENIANEIRKIEDAIGLTSAQMKNLSELFDRLRGAATMEQIAAAAAELAEYFQSITANGQQLPPELASAANAVINLAKNAAEANTETEKLPQSFNRAAAAASGLSREIAAAAGYAASLRAAIDNLQFTNIGLAAENAAIAAGQSQLAAAAAGRLAEERAKLAPLLEADNAAARTAAQREFDRLKTTLETNVALREQNAELIRAASASRSAGGGAAKISEEMKKAEESAKELAQELDRIAQQNMQRVTETANDLVDYMLGGFRDGMKGIEGIFLESLKNMIATASRNQIVLQLGAAGGFSPAQIEAARQTQMGGMFGSLGGLFGSLGTGFSNVLNGLFSGGLKGAFGAIGTAIGGAIKGGLTGIGTALGAIAAPIALISGLIPRSRVTGRGVTGMLGGSQNQLYNYTDKQTSALFGLIKWSSRSTSPADPRLVTGIQAATDEVNKQVRRAAGILAIGADAVGTFTKNISVSLAGLTEEQAFNALQGAVDDYADGLAAAVLATDRYVRAGEGQMDALMRLAESLTTVNRVMDNLGHSFRAVGLAGADMASKLADAFGGLDAFAAATKRYFDLFYTEEERRAAITRQVTAELARLNIAMPISRDQYRALVASLDVTTEAGREAYAALITMADAFDFILSAATALSRAAAELQGIVSTEIASLITRISEAQRANIEAARSWYRTAQTLRQFIDDMLGRPGAMVSGAQAMAFNQRRFNEAVQAAIGGDQEAARSLPDAARALLDSTRLMARDRVELARAEAQVLASLGLVAGVSDIEGARHDVIAGLQQEQIDLLTDIRDFLAQGGSLDEAKIAELNSQLGALEDAIKAAEMINYNFLQQRLRVTVNLIANANIPDEVRQLLASAGENIRANIDFIARTRNLTPDLKFLALTSASEHLKTVRFLAENNLGHALTRVALTTAETLTRTVQLVAAANMPADLKRLALTGNSELLRTVNVVLASGADQDAIKIALGNVARYNVAIRAALHPGTSDEVRRIVFGETGSYTAMIRAAVTAENLTPAARRILLRQQGDYIASIVGIIGENTGDAEKRLLLRNNTNAARFVTISTVFASEITPEQKRLLLRNTTNTIRNIIAQIDATELDGLSAGQRQLFLQKRTEAIRAVIAQLNLAALNDLPPDRRQLFLRNATEAVRTVMAQMNVDSLDSLTPERRALFLQKATQAVRNVSAQMNLSGLLDLPSHQRRLFLLDSTEAIRTIVARVNTDNLTAPQLALLNAIQGGADGKLTLGGTFVFDPSGGFKTWYENTTRAALTVPMDSLRTALDNLTTQIRADVATRTRAQQQADAERIFSGLTRNAENAAFVTDPQLLSLAMALGIRTDGKTPQQIRNAIVNWSPTDAIAGLIYDPTGSQRQAYLDSLIPPPPPPPPPSTPPSTPPVWRHGPTYRERGFANGGMHMGGIRLVGERGPELEVTGPARYYSATQTAAMLSGGNTAEEIRALREEVRLLREEQRQLGITTATSTKRTVDVLRKWDVDGLPPERD